MRRLAALALACAVMPHGAAAREGDQIEAHAGDLTIIHLWSRDPDGFRQAWLGSTPPNLPTTSRTARNEQIQQFILYVNCKPDGAGKCRLRARVVITAPDGTPYGEPLEFMAMPALQPVGRDIIGLTPNGIALTVEDGEQLGEYRIDLAVTDETAGVTARSTVHIEVVEAQ